MWFLVTLLLLIVFAVLLSLVVTFFTGATWSPTPMRTVRRMLRMAGVRTGEKVYDLGSGDGRIALIAAREFGAASVGVEVNPLLALIAKLRVSWAGSRDKVKIVWGNMYDLSFRDADVVAVYLSPQGNRKLKGKLERELKDGARIVSHRWEFKGWEPVEVDPERKIYLYRWRGRSSLSEH
jgi:cyclopropane fatty-acyl-phospholipid synthase-like methyltransferase